MAFKGSRFFFLTFSVALLVQKMKITVLRGRSSSIVQYTHNSSFGPGGVY